MRKLLLIPALLLTMTAHAYEPADLNQPCAEWLVTLAETGQTEARMGLAIMRVFNQLDPDFFKYVMRDIHYFEGKAEQWGATFGMECIKPNVSLGEAAYRTISYIRGRPL